MHAYQRDVSFLAMALAGAVACGEQGGDGPCLGPAPRCDCGYGVVGTPACDPTGFYVCECPPFMPPDPGEPPPVTSPEPPYAPPPPEVPEPEQPSEPVATCLGRIEGPYEPMLGPVSDPTESDPVKREDGNMTCTERTHSLERDLGSIVALGDAYASLQPGLVANAESAYRGVVQPLSIPRAPVRISIDLPVTQSSRLVPTPSSASLADAVASLKREADEELGNLPELPARLDVQVFAAHDFEQAMSALGISASYSDPFVDGGFRTAIDQRRSSRTTSVVMRLFQPMYTISVAEDEIFQNRDFFREGIDYREGSPACDILAASAEPPAYIRSVTYGRVIYYAVSSEEFHKAEDFRAALNVAVRGIGASGRVDVEYRDEFRQRIQRSEVRVVVFGGSQEQAMQAIREGDFSPFLQPTRAINAVPLAYRAHFVARGRPLMTMREATSFTQRCCVPTQCPPAPTQQHVCGTWRHDTGWHFHGESRREYATVGGRCRSGRVREGVHSHRANGNGHCMAEWVTNDPHDCRATLRYSRSGSSFVVCEWTMFERETLPHPDPLCRGGGGC